MVNVQMYVIVILSAEEYYLFNYKTVAGIYLLKCVYPTSTPKQNG
jgi:hypothetical protein